MKRVAPLLLDLYKKMPAEKKIKLGFQWSELVRKVNKEGLANTKVKQNG